ncbi:MAG: polyphosphate polymerase domain-containing protein [Propionibacteriaceae bacterium]|jgi:hypothetical protein|nr:polyphosphate polymerase domain-containing protein [Propionibacteriaceae bacterium]
MIATLAPVGLDELNARAALLTRVDRKYVIPLAQLPAVMELVPDTAQALEIDGRRAFGYRSTYFDTPGRLTYRLAATRRRRRFKVRTRCYDTGSSFLEVKTRAGAGRTVKRRLESPDYLPQWVAYALSDSGIALDAFALAPSLDVAFERSTLLLGDARITIDTGLSWQLPTGAARQANLAVVETKSAGRPTEFDIALWRAGHRPDRMSKYATGLAWLCPELSGNRWHRTLSRYFEGGQ